MTRRAADALQKQHINRKAVGQILTMQSIVADALHHVQTDRATGPPLKHGLQTRQFSSPARRKILAPATAPGLQVTRMPPRRLRGCTQTIRTGCPNAPHPYPTRSGADTPYFYLERFLSA